MHTPPSNQLKKLHSRSNPSSGQRKIYVIDLAAFFECIQLVGSHRMHSILRHSATSFPAFDAPVHTERTRVATISRLKSGRWRVQVRRKGKYVNETFLRRKTRSEARLSRCDSARSRLPWFRLFQKNLLQFPRAEHLRLDVTAAGRFVCHPRPREFALHRCDIDDLALTGEEGKGFRSSA